MPRGGKLCTSIGRGAHVSQRGAYSLGSTAVQGLFAAPQSQRACRVLLTSFGAGVRPLPVYVCVCSCAGPPAVPASVPGPRIGPQGGSGAAPAAAPVGRKFRSAAAAAEQPLHHDPRRHVDAPVAAAAVAGALQWSVDAATAATDVLAATCAAAAPVQQAVTCMVTAQGRLCCCCWLGVVHEQAHAVKREAQQQQQQGEGLGV